MGGPSRIQTHNLGFTSALLYELSHTGPDFDSHVVSSALSACCAGGPAAPPSHPKRSPSSVAGADRDLKEEGGRMASRKVSSSVVGSRSIQPPSSPMVSSANNPNKSEIPDRRKEIITATVNTHAHTYRQAVFQADYMSANHI